MAPRHQVLACSVLVLAVLVPSVVAAGERRASAFPPRDRSLELVDHHCRTEIGSRRVTLFANGTIRVRDEVEGEVTMALGELPPDHLEGVLRRLWAEDLSEADRDRLSPEGDWVDHCRLRLHIRAGEEEHFTHGTFDSLPLSLSRILAVIGELAELTRIQDAEALPTDYRPRTGDVLKRVDDVLFEVVGFTSDGKGVELQGVDQPLTLFIRPEDLRTQFTGPVRR